MKKLLCLLAIAFCITPAFSQSLSKVTFNYDGGLDVISVELEPNVMLMINETGNVIRFGEDIFRESGVENWENKVKDYMGRVEYYANTENEAFRGKVKSIGRTTVTYYASYNNEAFRGRLKSIGSTELTYYSSTDDKAYKGKLKSIGGSQYTYYSSFDRQEYRGRMKTGNQSQVINSVKYFLKG